MTPHLDYTALSPELVLTATIALIFVVDLFISGTRRALTVLACVGTAASLACTVALLVATHHGDLLSGSFVVDDFALLTKALFLGCALVVLLMGVPGEWKGEYLLLVLASLLGSLLVVSARELVSFIVAFELLAVPGYLLTGWRKRSAIGHEAALKFFLLGVVATAVMLYGASLIFGLAGSTNFKEIAEVMASADGDAPLAAVGIVFVIAGMAFKFSAVPLHFWAPDAYQGAPLPVAAFLSVLSKAAGLFALAVVALCALPGSSDVWGPLLAVLAVVTMTVGNVVALRQVDLIRLVAYSSIAQTGYALIPIAVVGRYGGSTDLGLESLFEFMLIYSLTNLAAFAVAISIRDRVGSTSLDSLKGLFHSDPGRAIALTVAMLSLAGIPPVGGWFAKLVIFRAGIEADSGVGLALVIFAAANTAIGLFYYATVVAKMWGTPDEKPIGKADSKGLSIAIAAMVVAVIVTGVFPGLVTHLGDMMSFIA